MKFQKSNPLQGKFLDKSKYVGKDTDVTIVNEAKEYPSQFNKDDGSPQMQIKAQIQVPDETDPQIVTINRATKDALVDAFGEDSKSWQGKSLKLICEKGIVGGRRVIFAYLVPVGYVIKEDSGGFVVIVKEGENNLPEVNEDTPF